MDMTDDFIAEYVKARDDLSDKEFILLKSREVWLSTHDQTMKDNNYKLKEWTIEHTVMKYWWLLIPLVVFVIYLVWSLLENNLQEYVISGLILTSSVVVLLAGMILHDRELKKTEKYNNSLINNGESLEMLIEVQNEYLVAKSNYLYAWDHLKEMSLKVLEKGMSLEEFTIEHLEKYQSQEEEKLDSLLTSDNKDEVK